MSTPNFARPSNASKYFVVLTGREENKSVCNECGDEHYEWEEDYICSEGEPCANCGSIDIKHEEEYRQPEQFEYDDLIDNIGHDIKENGGIKENKYLDNSRYSIQSLGYFKETKHYGDIDVTIKITAVIQSAYYEGATLDYLIEVESRGDSWKHNTGSHYDNDLDSIMDDVFDPYYTDLNKGLCKIMIPKALNWCENTIERLSSKVEGIFEGWSEHKLKCKGVFSNGEAIYEQTT